MGGKGKEGAGEFWSAHELAARDSERHELHHSLELHVAAERAAAPVSRREGRARACVEPRPPPIGLETNT